MMFNSGRKVDLVASTNKVEEILMKQNRRIEENMRQSNDIINQAQHTRVPSFLPKEQFNNYMEFAAPLQVIDTEEDDTSIENFRALQKQIS